MNGTQISSDYNNCIKLCDEINKTSIFICDSFTKSGGCSNANFYFGKYNIGVTLCCT